MLTGDRLFSLTAARRTRRELAIDDPGNAVFHEGFAEVEKVPEFETG
jgi:hypothetical protein